MRLRREEVGKKREAAPGAVDQGQRLCTPYAKERRADGDCSFMDAHGYCNDAHTDSLGSIEKKRRRRKQGAEARVSGNRPNEEGGGANGGLGRRSSRGQQ